MKIFRRRSINFKIFLVALVCSCIAILPTVYCVKDAYDKIKRIRSEDIGLEILQSLTLVAHNSFLGLTGMTDAQKQVIENAASDVAKNSELLSKIETDQTRKGVRSRSAFSPNVISALPFMSEKGGTLMEMCYNVAQRTGMFANNHADSHLLVDSSTIIIPQVYSDIFSIEKLMSDWSDETGSWLDIFNVSSSLRDDAREVSNMLKRMPVNSDIINYTSLSGSVNPFLIACDELCSALDKSVMSKETDSQKIFALISNVEKTAFELWMSSTNILEQTINARKTELNNNIEKFLIIYGLVVLFAVFFFILITLIIRNISSKTLRLSKLTSGGMLNEAIDYYEKNLSGASDEFSKIDTEIISADKMFISTLSNIRKLAFASEDIELSTDSFLKRLRPNYENMESSIGQISLQSSKTKNDFESLSTYLNQLCKNFDRISEDIETRSGQILTESAKVVYLSDGIKSMLLSLGEVKKMFESLDSILQTFSEIAERANLLALNMAIETQKSGVVCNGIGVLVEQIRSLSIRTSVAVLDIESVRDSITSKLEDGFSSSETFVDTSVSHLVFIKNISSELRKVSVRIGELNRSTLEMRERTLSQSREDTALLLASLRNNMETTGSALTEFSLSVNKSLTEFARIMSDISSYK